MSLERDNVINWILFITVGTLSIVVLSVVSVMLYGFFHSDVDNNKIFELIGPAFNTVIGAFVGIIGGISLTRDRNKEHNE